MTESDADFIASLKNLREVQFSLYSLDEETHDKITRLKGSCAKTKNDLKSAEKIGIKAHPLYWVIPEIHKSCLANVTIEKAMSELHYEGFKIHPRGHIWNLNDKKTATLADEVFSYAENHNLMILLHCGEGDFELPNKFEAFIARHPNAKVQLAHIRPLDITLEMLKKYPNTFCDTAFVFEDIQEEVCNAGFADRIRLGTDFSITHYYFCKPSHDPTTEELITFLKIEK